LTTTAPRKVIQRRVPIGHTRVRGQARFINRV
jgi:hypothetical protein